MKYATLEAFRAAKRSARDERDRYAGSLSSRWDRLQDPVSRGILMRDALGDALMSWKPYRSIHDLLHGRVSGDMVASIGMAAAGLNRSWTKRVLYSGLSMLVGKAMGSNGVAKGSGIISLLAQGIGGVVDKVRDRRRKRAARAAMTNDQV